MIINRKRINNQNNNTASQLTDMSLEYPIKHTDFNLVQTQYCKLHFLKVNYTGHQVKLIIISKSAHLQRGTLMMQKV